MKETFFISFLSNCVSFEDWTATDRKRSDLMVPNVENAFLRTCGFWITDATHYDQGRNALGRFPTYTVKSSNA